MYIGNDISLIFHLLIPPRSSLLCYRNISLKGVVPSDGRTSQSEPVRAGGSDDVKLQQYYLAFEYLDLCISSLPFLI